MIYKGDFVTRNSYNNDIIFKDKLNSPAAMAKGTSVHTKKQRLNKNKKQNKREDPPFFLWYPVNTHFTSLSVHGKGIVLRIILYLQDPDRNNIIRKLSAACVFGIELYSFEVVYKILC